MLARVAPFALYVGFLVGESIVGDTVDARWRYATQITAVAALLVWFWSGYAELRGPARGGTRDWLLALLIGTIVFVAWINLDFGWAQLGAGRGVAGELSGNGATGAEILLRVAGAVLVVPVMEELFWRSFLIRWLERATFLSVDPRTVRWRSILLAAAVFGAEHHLWLAGIVAGIAYGWLYRRTGILWTAVLAHALTNALLEAWAHRTANWHLL